MISRTTQIMDGNQAAAYIAYSYSQVAAIYPITPSSPMAELVSKWADNNRKNIFHNPLIVATMQSEAGAAGAVHGALLAGALATTFTSSQGLLLMIPNIYRIAGELLPGVIHVAARTIATHALSIFGDHSDIYACRQTGAAIFAHSSVQEVMDLSPVAHLSALCGRLPFINFFDGFRTSHELQKIAVWSPENLNELFDEDVHTALAQFRKRSLHPRQGRVYGQAQNPDIFFQVREAANSYYQALPDIVEKQLLKINVRLGTHYGLFDFYGDSQATHVVIAMGSVCETVKEYIDANPQERNGLIIVRLYRPFSVSHFLDVMPTTVEQITILNRTKEPGSTGEPLFLDVVAALQDSPFRDIPVFSGRYGLSSKDTTPAQIAAVYRNTQKKSFTVGITDDVTRLSLPVIPIPSTTPKDVYSCKFWGLGGDGTISATKNIVKIVGMHSDRFVQGYFEYDSKKSRGLTLSHLRFASSPIRSPYLIESADFVACHNPVYLHKYDMLKDVRDGGTFLLNCYYKERDLEDYLPGQVKAYIYHHHIRLYLIDAIGIGKRLGLNSRISTILQAAFFAVSGLLPADECKSLMKEAALRSYGNKGEKIIQMNNSAIDLGFSEVVKVAIPESWKDACATTLDNPVLPDRPEILSYVKNLQQPMTDRRGNDLPVSAFLPYADGYTPPGSTAHERRNITTEIPVWKPENCIQCNRCSYVCPHAVIRPVAMTKKELQKAPKGMESLPMTGMPEYAFSITISSVDCTGCGCCVGVCPGKQEHKALEMLPIHEHKEQQQYFDYGKAFPGKKDVIAKFRADTVKGSQFARPLMEFSGACAGCGETPYVKLLTQLFGPSMYIANATGCSSIWANSSPSTAYTVDEHGHGPAWSNSLFEDAAEFGYGMLLAQKAHAKQGEQDETIQWVIGGDGWAYDIGFSGVDHILASGENVNMLVLDTEVYSNTGGQASKATPLGSTAKFIEGGKKTRKKDLASIAMTYGNAYVAQIAMGADYTQTMKALTEAAAFPGPSLIIAYATCIAHGIRSGLGSSQHEEHKAVEAGYFHLFRFNPALKAEGRNPFILDSKEPTLSYEEFLAGENRYDMLNRLHPEEAKELFRRAERQAQERYQYLKKLQTLWTPE